MQKGYKYDLFVKGANGVGFAYEKRFGIRVRVQVVEYPIVIQRDG